MEGSFGYDLDRTLDEIRPGYTFDVTCQGSVPEAIIAFLESEGYEDAVRKAREIPDPGLLQIVDRFSDMYG